MCSNIMRVRNNLYKISLLFQISNHCFSCFVTIHTCIFTTILFVDRRIIVHDIDLRKIMAFSDFKVVRVVSRCNLNSTCSEFFVYIIICNDRNLSVCQRQKTFFSYDIFVSLIIRMYCDCRISKHCLRTCCRNLKEIICSNDRIFDMPEESILLFMLYFRIRKRCLTYRTPVNNTGTFVNKSFLMQADKYLLYSLGAAFIHCKSLSVPVTGNTKFL